MPVFSRKTNRNSNSTADLVNEINMLLSDMKKAKDTGTTQKGGNKKIVSEVNHLLSELRGVESNLNEDQLVDFAMKGGARRGKRAKKSKSRSSSRKSRRSRSRSRTQSRAVKKTRGRRRRSRSRSVSRSVSRSKSRRGKGRGRGKRGSRSRSRSVSRSRSRSRRSLVSTSSAQSRSRSRGRSVSRSVSRSRSRSSRSKSRSRSSRRRGRGRLSREGGKRAPNDYIIKLTALKKHIKDKLPNEILNNVGAMSKAAAKVLNANDRDTEKAKKNFNATSFLKDYTSARKEIEAKRAAKKANKV